MATKPQVLHPAFPRVCRMPGARVRWLAVIAGMGAPVVTLAIVLAVRGWSLPLAAIVIPVHAWLAFAAAAMLQQLRGSRRTLRTQITALERDYAALRRHTAGAAHDMRAPMVTVNSYLELLAAGEFGTLPASARRAAEQAARASTRARLLVDAALAASLGDADPARAPRSRVDLNAVLGDVIVSLGADVARTHADVTVGTLPIVRGSESAYYRVFENLVQNALRYAKPGASPRLEVTASEGAYGVEITVRDEGCGIPAAERERVFADRVRGSDVACAGTGLGLATVRELVAGLGGAVWIDPDVHDGTCVRVRLPLAAGDALFAR